MGFLSIKMLPVVTSYKRETRLMIDVFPEPVFPNIAIVSPGFTVKEMFLSAVMFVSS